MKNTKLRSFLSALTLFSMLLAITSFANAAPVRYSQVVQVVNVKPGKASTGGFTQLRLSSDDKLVSAAAADGDDDDKKIKTPRQDDRVIVETRTDIIAEDACDCEQPVVGGGFPKYALLGLAAIPIGFLIFRRRNTPTPTPTQTQTPPTTGTPTPPPTETPTPTSTPTPPPPTETPTPPMSPTPEPIPEPITILLFGTGLAGIGVAARKRFRRKDDEEENTEPE